jgi:hypothetical protein
MPCKLSHTGPDIHGPKGQPVTLEFTSDTASVFITNASYNGQDVPPESFDVDQDRKGAALTFTIASEPKDLSMVFGMITNMTVAVQERCAGAQTLRLHPFIAGDVSFGIRIVGD